MPSSVDANLLLGAIAYQMGFVTRDQLLAAIQQWTANKKAPLTTYLARNGAMTADDIRLLVPLARRHVQLHDNSPERSLAALSIGDSIRDILEKVSDPDVTVLLPKQQQPAAPIQATPAKFATRFRIIRPHAKGGLGEVFLATDNELRREVALKQIQPKHADNADSKSRFIREAEITGALEHPGIVPVYGLGTYEDGRPFYAMRFVRGQSLLEAAKAFHSEESPGKDAQRNLEQRRLLQQFIDVCEAIDYAHNRGVLHRDLKPGNIMLGRYGETLVVDWGIAKVVAQSSTPGIDQPVLSDSILRPNQIDDSNQSNDQTEFGSAIGTPAYMSPEQAKGQLDLIGPASDVFSLGATLYHLATGKPPYTAATRHEVLESARECIFPRPRSINAECPMALEAICLKAMALRPEHRFASAKKLADDVERYLADEALEAMPDGVIARVGRWSRKNRQWVQAGVVAVMLLALTAGIAYFREAQLAYEKGELAKSNGQLATQQTRLAQANAKLAADEKAARERSDAQASALRKSLTSNLLVRSRNEFNSGRRDLATNSLKECLAITETDPSLHPFVRDIFQHRVFPNAYVPIPGTYLANFHPDGDLLVVGSLNGPGRLIDALSSTPVGEPLSFAARIDSIAFSGNGKVLVTGCNAATLGAGGEVHPPESFVQFWNARTGAPLHVTLRFDEQIASVAINQQGDRAVVVLGTNARLWNVTTGKEILLENEISGTAQTVYSAIFHPDGRQFVTGGEQNDPEKKQTTGAVRFWDSTTGRALPMVIRDDLKRGGDTLRNITPFGKLAFNDDGSRLVSGHVKSNLSGVALVWETATGMPVGPPIDHEGLHTVEISPKGDRVLTQSTDKVKLWDAKHGSAVGNPIQINGSVRYAAFCPPGDRILVVDESSARLYRADQGMSDGKPIPLYDKIYSAQVHPHGNRFLTVGEQYATRLHEGMQVPVSEQTAAREEFGPQVGLAYTAPNGRHNRIGPTKVWRTKQAQAKTRAVVEDISPGSDRILCRTPDKGVQLWNTVTGEPLGTTIQPMDGEVRTTMFSPDGKRFIVQSDQEIAVHASDTGEPTGLQTTSQAISCVAFSPDGGRIAVGSGSMVEVWSFATGARSETSAEFPIISLAFSPTGKEIAVANGNLVQVGNLPPDRSDAPMPMSIKLGNSMQHDAPLKAVNYDAFGRIITICSRTSVGGIEFEYDGTVQLWDAATGKPASDPMRHSGSVRSVTFSEDGRRIVTLSDDFMEGSTLFLWSSLNGELLSIVSCGNFSIDCVSGIPTAEKCTTLESRRELLDGQNMAVVERVWDISTPVMVDDIPSFLSLVSARAPLPDLKTLEQFAAQNTDWLKKCTRTNRERARRFHAYAAAQALKSKDSDAQRFHEQRLDLIAAPE